MYKPNKRHLQPLLISIVNALPEKKRKRVETSWTEDFYRDFFCRTDEEAFAVLHVDHPFRYGQGKYRTCPNFYTILHVPD